MLLLYVVTLALLAAPAVSSPISSPTSGNDDTEPNDLETSETGHFRGKRIWRKLIKQLSSLGGYGLGGSGLAGYGIDLLTGLGHHHNHNYHGHHHHGNYGSYGGGGHGGDVNYGYGGHPAGHYGPSAGVPYGGHAQGHSYAPTYSYGHSLPLATTLYEHPFDLGLWGPSLDIHNNYGWGTDHGLTGGSWL